MSGSTRSSRKSIGGSSMMLSMVQTATTPGEALAAAVSMPTIRPCATGERTTRMCSCDGNETSAANRPRPVTSGASSRRSTEAPTTDEGFRSSCAMMSIRCGLFGSRVRSRLHVHVDELHGRLGLVQHAPALHPVVGALQLVGRDRRRVDEDDAALADVLGLEHPDLGVLGFMVVDEIV